jgi:hypothetical protein
MFRRSRRDRVPYPIWRDQGLLMATEGNTTDFKFIEPEILELGSRFVITELAAATRRHTKRPSPTGSTNKGWRSSAANLSG